jgi:hypothetical protein
VVPSLLHAANVSKTSSIEKIRPHIKPRSFSNASISFHAVLSPLQRRLCLLAEPAS